MQLRSLRLESFRGISLEFAIPGRAVAIVGKNGSGKSSILEACAVLLGFLIRQTASLDNPRPLGFDDETWRVDGPRAPVLVSGRLTSGESSFDLTARRVQGVDESVASGLEDSLAPASPGLRPLFAHYRTGRLWFADSAQQAGDDDTWRSGYRGCLDPAVSDRNWAPWLAAGVNGATRRDELLEKVFRVLHEVTGIQGGIFVDDRGEFLFRSPQHYLPLRLLPDGVRNLLTILFDMTARAAKLNPNANAGELFSIPGIVLLDEVDLHLHPAWQRAAVNMLLSTFPRVQYIVTTHSPFVLKELPPGAVVNLDGHHGTNDGSIEDITESVLGVTVPQRSLRQQRLVEAARAYFSAMHTATDEQLSSLRAMFDEAKAPFADDAAAIALLNLEELAAHGRRG